MVTDGVETVSVILDALAETEIDFCVPFKELKDLVRAEGLYFFSFKQMQLYKIRLLPVNVSRYNFRMLR